MLAKGQVQHQNLVHDWFATGVPLAVQALFIVRLKPIMLCNIQAVGVWRQ